MDTYSGYEVIKEISGIHPLHANYPLMHRDLLVEDDNGTFSKVAQGMGIMGFRLTPEQLEEYTRPVQIHSKGLNFRVVEPPDNPCEGSWCKRGIHGPNEATEPHTCPFKVEIGEDTEFRCECCDECRGECAEEI